MPDKDGRPYLRELRKVGERQGIVTHQNARQRKAQLVAEVKMPNSNNSNRGGGR